MAKKKVHQSHKIGKACKSVSDDSYFLHFEETKDATQRSPPEADYETIFFIFQTTL